MHVLLSCQVSYSRKNILRGKRGESCSESGGTAHAFTTYDGVRQCDFFFNKILSSFIVTNRRVFFQQSNSFVHHQVILKMEGPPLSPPPPPPTDDPPGGDDHYSATVGCYSLPTDMTSYSPGSPPPPLVNQQGQLVSAGQPQVVQVSPLINAVAPTLSSASGGATAASVSAGGGGAELSENSYQQNNLPLLRHQLKVSQHSK